MKDSDGNNCEDIFGLAIVKYDDSGAVYRLSCDFNWESVNDSSYDTIDEARAGLSENYDIKQVRWIKL